MAKAVLSPRWVRRISSSSEERPRGTGLRSATSSAAALGAALEVGLEAGFSVRLCILGPRAASQTQPSSILPDQRLYHTRKFQRSERRRGVSVREPCMPEGQLGLSTTRVKSEDRKPKSESNLKSERRMRKKEMV